MRVVLVIPARYGSKRLPGKPLVPIAGKALVERVHAIARAAVAGYPEARVLVATEDDRVARFCAECSIECVMTKASCPSGSDRALAAVEQLPEPPDFVINLQGDNPLAPPWFVRAIIDRAGCAPAAQVITLFERLTWPALTALRANKAVTPFSGTCVVTTPEGNAVWFSKSIIPAVRTEDRSTPYSPVLRHIGIYGYSYAALQRFQRLPRGHYEALEELEQLRFLEHGIPICMLEVDYRGRTGMSGVDAPEDIGRAEAIIAREGELV